MDTISIREVTPIDAERLVEIYSYYVENTAITFEYDVPTVEEFRERIINTKKAYPYICAVKDGKILGYAYASRYRERAAFMYCVEMSIYVDRNVRKSGIGRLLYEEIEKRLKDQGIKNLYAAIAYPVDPNVEDVHLDTSSKDFHTRMGYVLNGEFHKCGYKFQNWYDLIWMEKFIGDHS